MEDISDDLIEEIIRRISETVSNIDVGEIISSTHDVLSETFTNLSDFSSLSEEARETLINSIVESIGGSHDAIAQNIEIISNINSDSFSGIDADSFSPIQFDTSDDSISFCGKNDNTDAIKYQEQRLREANHDIDYYGKEISNFTDKTSATYQDTCRTRLAQAVAKAKEAANKIQNLKS